MSVRKINGPIIATHTRQGSGGGGGGNRVRPRTALPKRNAGRDIFAATAPVINNGYTQPAANTGGFQ